MEETHRLLLVVAQEERPPGDRVVTKVDRERRTVDVAREVFDGKAGLDEGLLERSAHARLDG